jgi:hypothetical protein
MTRRRDEPPKGDDTGWNDESAPETPPAAPTHEEWGDDDLPDDAQTPTIGDIIDHPHEGIQRLAYQIGWERLTAALETLTARLGLSTVREMLERMAAEDPPVVTQEDWTQVFQLERADQVRQAGEALQAFARNPSDPRARLHAATLVEKFWREVADRPDEVTLDEVNEQIALLEALLEKQVVLLQSRDMCKAALTWLKLRRDVLSGNRPD